jgi:hypothetical protein
VFSTSCDFRKMTEKVCLPHLTQFLENRDAKMEIDVIKVDEYDLVFRYYVKSGS